jgi:glycosyltransferase involved in cell wall biosynthesis
MHNEADNVAPLHREITTAVGGHGKSAEIIYIDDGSTDGTWKQLATVHRAGADGGPRVRVIRLRRRFGKASALAAGFDVARGGIVLTMDGDLQDDPREIPRFLAKLDEGCDMVSGWKRKRRDPFTKVVASRIFNRVTSLLTGIHIHDFNCGFKAYRSELVRDLNLYGGMHRYIPVLAHAKGYRVDEIVVEHRARQRGKSKYGAGRLATGFLDLLTVVLLTGYASRPLHFFGGSGLVAFLSGSGICAYMAVEWFMGNRPIGNRPLLLLGILLMILGIQLISTGLVGELIVSRSGSQREQYSIAEQHD